MAISMVMPLKPTYLLASTVSSMETTDWRVSPADVLPANRKGFGGAGIRGGCSH